MPDWEALVSEQFAAISLEPEDRREVIAELAGHLEEAFEQLCGQGLSEEAAAERALSQVKNWQSLRRKIQKARMKEDVMTDRVKQVWLPGFLTLFLSLMLLMAIQFFGPQPAHREYVWLADDGSCGGDLRAVAVVVASDRRDRSIFGGSRWSVTARCASFHFVSCLAVLGFFRDLDPGVAHPRRPHRPQHHA